jgi:hypothetical protein
MSKSWEYNHISQHTSTENDVIGTQSEGDFGESPTDAPTPKANVQDSPYTGSAKKIYTHFNERKLRCIIDYCKSTIYFRQHNNTIYVFTSI